jgi:phenylpyruvate tautomerase PptA (4-oxalocrotonate tautomerase family)
MPLYECTTVEGTLDDEQRRCIAEGIVAAHVEETGAPAELVHVAFPELPEGHLYTNGEPSRTAAIRGSIRAGRPMEVRHRLINRINDIYIAQTGVSPMRVLVAVVDFPSQWAMEGGHILPDVTAEDEEAWLMKIRGEENAPAATS